MTRSALIPYVLSVLYKGMVTGVMLAAFGAFLLALRLIAQIRFVIGTGPFLVVAIWLAFAAVVVQKRESLSPSLTGWRFASVNLYTAAAWLFFSGPFGIWRIPLAALMVFIAWRVWLFGDWRCRHDDNRIHRRSAESTEEQVDVWVHPRLDPLIDFAFWSGPLWLRIASFTTGGLIGVWGWIWIGSFMLGIGLRIVKDAWIGN